jgi:Flp pilus assembly protein TadD
MDGRLGSGRPAPGWLPALLAGTIFLLALVVYRAALGFGFVNLDDQTYVYANPMVVRGLSWEGLAWALGTVHGSNWHPLTWLSHMADVELFGLDAGKHHLVSVLLHALDSVLLFAWLRMASGSLWRSAAAGALFAVHPLHVESVAWVSERKDVLSTLFWLLALIAYVGWARRKGVLRYLAVVAAFALGLLSKPMVITFPFALLLVDAWPLGRLGGPQPDEPIDVRRLVPLVREKVPLFLLAIGSAAATWVAQRDLAAARLDVIPLGDRIANAFVAYATYLGKTFWPSGLAALYPHPTLSGRGLAPWIVGASAALVLGVTWIAVRTWRSRPYLAWGWFWFLGTLVPVIGIVQVGVQSHADRYAYIPSIGILVAGTWLAGSLLGGSRISRTAGAAFAVAAIGGLGVVATNQVGYWRDSEAVWRRALAVTTGNWQAWAGLGDALSESGRPAEAVQALSRALELQPGNAVAWNGLGVALGQLGRVADAVPRFQQAVQLDPAYADAWYNLGTAQGNLGQHALAVQALEKAVALQPASARSWANLVIARAARGDGPGAADALRRVEQLDPEAARRLRRN